jgi:tetratricopeptide (TPR) repeat protein
MQQPFEAPQNTALTPQAMGTAVTAQPLKSQAGPTQAIADRLVAPSQQSTQYAELQRRLNRYYTDRLQTDEERYRGFLTQLRAKEAADKAALEKTPTAPAAQPEAGGMDLGIPDYAKISRELLDAARATSPEAMKAAQEQGLAGKPKPVPVKSLAEGIKAAGLANVLRQAEVLMREGKFIAALDQYAVAEQVAPNNPLVRLGMAHAELGGGYYKRGEAHLREALAGDPTLLMGQYDLKGMVGQERLEVMVKDLKETARKQEDDSGLVFLLAYVAYNTGNEQQAGVYLSLAEKRAGGKDEFFKLLRLHWAVPGDPGAGVGVAGPLALSEVLKQFEEGNVASAVLTDKQLRGEFRSVVGVGGGQSVRDFAVDLPPGAASGTLGKWIQDHRKGAEVKVEVAGPATQPGG